MFVLLFDVFKYLLLRNTDVLKTCQKNKISWKENWNKFTSYEEQKSYKVYSGNRLLWPYYLQLSFVNKIMSQIPFNLFCSEYKRLLSDFLWK